MKSLLRAKKPPIWRFFHSYGREISLRTIVYVDGYNLYYGCLKHTDYKWLDLMSFFKKILHEQNPAIEIITVKYFTADIKAKVASRGQAAQISQTHYHNALTHLYPQEIQIIKGYYSLEKARLPCYQKPIDKRNRVDVWKLEEKQTDVNIALEAYRDAAKSLVDQLVFVSNDTDLEPVLKALNHDFGHLPLGVVIPILKTNRTKRPGNKRLSNYAEWTRKSIREDELKNSQLPAKIARNGKKPICKPKYW